MSGIRRQRGQSTVEWIGLVLLVALLAVGAGRRGWRQPAGHRAGPGDRPADRLRRRARRGLPGPARPGAGGRVRAPSSRRPCAATSRRSPTRRGCGRSRSTSAAAARTRARWARRPARWRRATTGEPVTLFVHVVDCRGRRGEGGERRRLRLLGRARRPPLPPVLGLLPGQPELARAPWGRRVPPRRLGVLPDPRRPGRARRPGQLAPRLQLRRRLELLALRRRRRPARCAGAPTGAATSSPVAATRVAPSSCRARSTAGRRETGCA